MWVLKLAEQEMCSISELIERWVRGRLHTKPEEVIAGLSKACLLLASEQTLRESLVLTQEIALLNASIGMCFSISWRMSSDLQPSHIARILSSESSENQSVEI